MMLLGKTTIVLIAMTVPLYEMWLGSKHSVNIYDRLRWEFLRLGRQLVI